MAELALAKQLHAWQCAGTGEGAPASAEPAGATASSEGEVGGSAGELGAQAVRPNQVHPVGAVEEGCKRQPCVEVVRVHHPP